MFPDRSDGVVAGFLGADADGLLDGKDEDLAVSDLAGLCLGHDGVRDPVGEVIAHDDFQPDLWQEVDRVFTSPIHLGMTLLAAEALDLGYGHALDADFHQALLHFLELEGFNDSYDEFHGSINEWLGGCSRDVTFLAVFADIEAGRFDFRRGSQADGDLDNEGDHGGGEYAPQDRYADGL